MLHLAGIKNPFTYLLLLSLSCNVFFLIRKTDRTKRDEEVAKLHFYKAISFHEGYNYFSSQLQNKYPETNIGQKYTVVYRWDSLLYEDIHRDQMKALDSMAATYGRYRLEYIFVTEMDEQASLDFLKRNSDDYQHAKMLFGMDDFISGLYHTYDTAFVKPIVINHSLDKNDNRKDHSAAHKLKSMSLYTIMDPKGKLLHLNGKRFRILKDSAFLKKLHALIPHQNHEILN